MTTPTATQAAPALLPEPLGSALREAVDKGLIELPLLPEVAGQVLAACSDEECDVRKLSELIQRDPSMAANLLRVANSALYASPIPIVSLQQAVTRLGRLRIREAAMIISCKTRVFRSGEESVRALFRHSVAAGTIAQELARMRRWNVEEAFLCGLLHDVGKPVMLNTLAELAQKLQISLSLEARDFAIDETHAAVGSALVKHWKLPARLAETIEFHHRPTQSANCMQTAMMTHFADEMAHFMLGDKLVSEEHIRQLPVLQTLNVYPDELDALFARKQQVLNVVGSLA